MYCSYPNSPVPREWCISVRFFIAVTPAAAVNTRPLALSLELILTRISHDMHHPAILGVGASVAAVRTELSRPEGSDKGTDAIDARVPVGGVGSNQLIGIAAELNAGVADEVEESELVVCRFVRVTRSRGMWTD